MQSIQLNTFLNQTQFISQQLSLIKKDIQSNATNTQYPDATASNYIERAINLRLAYRNLADGIQANRTLVQVQKEKIEKSKIFLQGLHYYKTTLLEKIKEAQIDVININQYVNKPIEINNWNQQFDQREEEIVGELEDKKKKQKLYEKLISEKARKEIQIKQKKELYEKVLPAQAKKILDQIQQTSKYFSIQEYSQFDSISNRDLSTVYDKLNSLRSKKIIELNYSKDQFQELEIIICKNEYKYYKQAVANKININDNEIKLTISSFAPHFNKLVIGLDRREDFTNEEVFQRLVNNQSIRPIFIQPRNQLERNINAKYVRLDWFDSLFLTGLLTPEALFDLIKERIFCLKLINNIIENIKKLVFFFPLNTQFESPVPNNLKKVSFGSLEKISTEAYLQIAYQPQWLQKYISSVQKSGTSMIAQNEDINRCNLLSFLKSLNVDEFLKPNMNTYYKGSLTIHQNVLSFVLIVPFSYPRHKSMIRIVQWHRKKEEDRKAAISDIPCKFHANIEAKILPDRILEAERAVNNNISCFFKGEEVGNPFRILIQINRLLTLLGESNDRKS